MPKMRVAYNIHWATNNRSKKIDKPQPLARVKSSDMRQLLTKFKAKAANMTGKSRHARAYSLIKRGA